METGAQNMQICGTVLQLFFPPHQLSQVITLPIMYSCFQLLTGLLLIIGEGENTFVLLLNLNGF